MARLPAPRGLGRGPHAGARAAARLGGPGLRLDALYVVLYRTVVLAFGRVVGWFDRYVVDGLVNAASAATLRAGADLRRLQTGRVQDYLYGVAGGRASRPGPLAALGVTCPVLSLVTATPFVAACLIMLFGRTRPLGVRLIAVSRRPSARAVASTSTSPTTRRRPGSSSASSSPRPRPRHLIELGVDGMSVSLVLLTAIIILAGVFASWTVQERDKEFFVLLFTLVTGVFGVFVSLDLFVFFLFYEIAVLPMYLLIGIWGSTGEVRPQGLFAWAFRETGVGTKEYAAMKLTLYLLLGSAFILVGIFVLCFAGGRRTTFDWSRSPTATFTPATQRWVFLALLRRLRRPGRHLAVPHLVARRPRLRAHRGVDAARRRADEARRLRRHARRRWRSSPRRRSSGLPLVGAGRGDQHRLRRARRMAQTDLKYVIAYSSVSATWAS